MIHLCSASKSRALLLKEVGLSFIQESCDYDEEQIRVDTPEEFVIKATQGKFEECLKRYGDESVLIAADTVVTANGKILRKAKDEEDAKRILNEQSGNSTKIVTYMIIGYKGKRVESMDVTEYLFSPFREEEIEAYLQSGEWRGKAGACMVEGFCKSYIKEVNGYESTAMGLCVEKVLEILADLT